MGVAVAGVPLGSTSCAQRLPVFGNTLLGPIGRAAASADSVAGRVDGLLLTAAALARPGRVIGTMVGASAAWPLPPKSAKAVSADATRRVKILNMDGVPHLILNAAA